MKQQEYFKMKVNEEIPAIPRYVECVEGPSDKLREKYPLQLIGWHTKRRCHSIHDNNVLLEEVNPQTLWIHPDDAEKRGINVLTSTHKPTPVAKGNPQHTNLVEVKKCV